MKEYGIKFKGGVVCKKLEPAIVELINFLSECSDEIERNIVITSMNDSKHMANSYHYFDRAIDVRIWNLIYNLTRWKPKASVDHIDFIQNQLEIKFPNQYDFVVEKNHIHIEYDPK